MVLSQISNKFHKFQQITKQGKEMYNVRQTRKNADYKYPIFYTWRLHERKSGFQNDMFRFVNGVYLFHMGWYTVPQFWTYAWQTS